MTLHDSARPWLALYDAEVPPSVKPRHASVIDGFRRAVREFPAHPAIRYFDATLSMAELDQASDALACALEKEGFAPGDRVAVYLQNVPQFVIAALAAWKLGGIVVTVNPMYQARELHEVLTDSGARVLVCHSGEKLAMATKTAHESGVKRVLVCDARAYQSRNDVRIFGPHGAGSDDDPQQPVAASSLVTESFEKLVGRYMGRVPRSPAVPNGHDVATLINTSGTTGPAKGVMSTHANIAQSVEIYLHWMALTRDDVIIAIAPLMHVTGMIAYLAVALCLPATLVLTYRFDPKVFRDAVRETGATYTIGPTTAFIALLNTADEVGDDLRSLSKIYSGGAPLPAAVVERFQKAFGHRILGIYGMTEATGPTHITPSQHLAAVDPATGTLAVGLPAPDTDVRILDDARQPVAVGALGELAISGPQVAAGYWNKPEETANAFTEHGFLTGDIGFMDAQGWFYIVDRKKDQINASGFKVWPREVEDVLYEHPAVSECAVVGIADSYRGETVGAFIVVRSGAQVTADEIRTFCAERMARFKVPGVVTFVENLPKTASGKILRRELRNSIPGVGQQAS